MTILHLTGPVLAGDDEVRSQAWVVGDRITYTKPTAHAGQATRVDGWVIPGLVDMHCHVSIGPAGPVDLDLARKYARTEAQAGVLLVRDVGSTIDLAPLQADPDLPRILRSGRFIARHKRYLPGYGVEIEPEQLADEVLRQARAGDGWVKLVADWIDRVDGRQSDLAPLWEPHQLAAAVAAGHGAGARLTAHTFSEAAITPLLDAGIDCLEHGTGMTEDHARRAVDAGVPVVPTLQQIANFESFAHQAEPKFPAYAATMRRMHARRYEHVRDLHRAGVTLLLGTDGGTSIGHAQPVLEALEMAKAIPAAEVVAAATWRARRFLGTPVLEEGDPADLVVLAADPREDVAELGRPRAVLRGGRWLAADHAGRGGVPSQAAGAKVSENHGGVEG